MSKTKKASQEVKHYLVFGEHWIEYPDYQGYKPADKMAWQTLKERFYENFSNDNPQLINIRKENNTISVHLHGFRNPSKPLIISLGSDGTIGRVALCKRIATGEYIAIHY